MTTIVTAPAAAAAPALSDERWTSYSATVLAICILGWAFDIYEATIMQLVTPILIKEWGITPATIGMVTTISRWVGLIGTFAFPVLADLYGRKRVLIWSILGYSVLTGLTGFSTGWVTLLIFSSLTRVALAGENPVGMLLVTETAPKKWRATALGGLVGGYPLGYFLCTLAALIVVPLWGWRALYFLGILPALLVLWVRLGINESPRYELVTAQMVKAGLKKQLDLLAPFRSYPRESTIASLIYFLYLFTWVGWSAWMPFYLATERKLGFPTMASYLSVWMFCAIFAYWICGWLCDVVGRRYVIPAFAVPAAILLVVMGYCDTPASLFWVGLATNLLITGSFGTGLGYTAEIFPTQIRGTAVGATFTIGLGFASLAPMIMGWIATKYSVAAGLPLLALSFLLLAPLFLWFAPDVTRKDLTDFVGQKVG
ncbi:MAG: MFS transporter [Rhizobiales bacterium]|nr:MFS transporter [Hyphomicrobiales bacterium]